MIGPHEGRELELMLAGKKKIAMFHDVLISGEDIPEEIIPERAFAPYVKNGSIVRIQKDLKYKGQPETIRYVFFVTPGEEWRVYTHLWITEETLVARHRKQDTADESIIGRLLDYSEEDIAHFISRKK